ncbi:hypothetical protein K5X82_12535 [Halosquirtibacter xylanolyticus]|uniref:hypothetical protein n=1 Tax=Halosquirtibacter xylanolyticus TaxID=3374599 RepID=UPI00374851FD|nr:hypothetical protein K5X82_12535 [Prolixibacteraceae bacterium]
MKNTFLSLILLLFSCVAIAQSKSDDIYDSIEASEAATYMEMSRPFISMSSTDLGAQQAEIVNHIDEVRFIHYDVSKNDLKPSFEKFVCKAFGKKPFKFYDIVNEMNIDRKDISFNAWVIHEKSKIQEFHILIRTEKEDQGSFLVSYYGEFGNLELDYLKDMAMKDIGL